MKISRREKKNLLVEHFSMLNYGNDWKRIKQRWHKDEMEIVIVNDTAAADVGLAMVWDVKVE